MFFLCAIWVYYKSLNGNPALHVTVEHRHRLLNTDVRNSTMRR